MCDLRNGCPPIHVFAGWADIFLAGSLEDFREIVASGSEAVLTIGDFSHWDVFKHAKIMNAGVLQWYDAKLKGVSAVKRKPVWCQLQGSDEWLEMDHFPPLSRRKVYYLGDIMTLNAQTSVEARPLEYVYDPESPTPAVGGPGFHPRNCGRMKQAVLERRDDVLVFTSEPIEEELLVIGTPVAKVYVESELEHFDIVVRLCVVQGQHSFNICDGMSRQGRYGDLVYKTAVVQCSAAEDPTTPPILCIEVSLGSCALRLKRGERVRLHVCSGAHPRWMRNYGTGEDVATATRLARNRIRLHRSQECSSCLELPVVAHGCATSVNPYEQETQI